MITLKKTKKNKNTDKENTQNCSHDTVETDGRGCNNFFSLFPRRGEGFLWGLMAKDDLPCSTKGRLVVH